MHGWCLNVHCIKNSRGKVFLAIKVFPWISKCHARQRQSRMPPPKASGKSSNAYVLRKRQNQTPNRKHYIRLFAYHCALTNRFCIFFVVEMGKSCHALCILQIEPFEEINWEKAQNCTVFIYFIHGLQQRQSISMEKEVSNKVMPDSQKLYCTRAMWTTFVGFLSNFIQHEENTEKTQQ